MKSAIIAIVIGFFSGGIGSLIGAWYSSRIERLRIRIKSLEDQLKYLYGPIMFFVTENEFCFSLNEKMSEAYKEKYVNQKWSQDEKTQQHLEKDADTTIAIMNDYIHTVCLNNEKIIDILKNNFHFLDLDDIDIFRQFLIDCKRLKIEFKKEEKRRTPRIIFDHLGNISFMKLEFIEKVSHKYKIKQDELCRLYKKDKKQKHGAQNVPTEHHKKA